MDHWYILHVRTGYEEKVKKLLENNLNRETCRVKQIIVPTENVAEISHGERTIKKRKYWPGYILIQLDSEAENDSVWHAIRTTPGVLSFLGAGETPVPLSEEEVQKIIAELADREKKPTPRVEFKPGDKVEIVDGPFINFSGIVEEVYPERERLKVSVSIFGRATLLELNYWQAEKV
ncbi:MAG: transcription termination/antitermination protein NusG [Candidatus Omnitrophica bacterium]|nr:transcription termination/antitermination protein NusG [Candidatus Omnitrophota bacterium]